MIIPEIYRNAASQWINDEFPLVEMINTVALNKLKDNLAEKFWKIVADQEACKVTPTNSELAMQKMKNRHERAK